jgi:hypothetical protein
METDPIPVIKPVTGELDQPESHQKSSGRIFSHKYEHLTYC